MRFGDQGVHKSELLTHFVRFTCGKFEWLFTRLPAPRSDTSNPSWVLCGHTQGCLRGFILLYPVLNKTHLSSPWQFLSLQHIIRHFKLFHKFIVKVPFSPGGLSFPICTMGDWTTRMMQPVSSSDLFQFLDPSPKSPSIPSPSSHT